MADEPTASNEQPKYQTKAAVPLRPVVGDSALTASGSKPTDTRG